MAFFKSKFRKYERRLFGESDTQSLSYVSFKKGFFSGFSASLDVFPTLNDKVNRIDVFVTAKQKIVEPTLSLS